MWADGRRQFLIGAGVILAAPDFAMFQSAQRVWRIGCLSLDTATSVPGQRQQQWAPEALGRLGYHLSKNLVLEWRFAETRVERLPQLADELVNVDLIITFVAVEAALAATRATRMERTSGLADRILRGAKPTALPIDAPTKYELVVNAKAARAMGYTLPPALRTRVDRVIE